MEQEKVGFIEKERALQSMQHEFNELLQHLRSKENEKNLATQKLHYLKEKECSLKDFLEKAEWQLKTIGDSIEYTQLQVGEEEARLQELQDRVETAKMDIEDKRRIFDEKRSGVDALRGRYDHAVADIADAGRKQGEAARGHVDNLAGKLAPVGQHVAAEQVHLDALEAPPLLGYGDDGSFLLCKRHHNNPATVHSEPRRT